MLKKLCKRTSLLTATSTLVALPLSAQLIYNGDQTLEWETIDQPFSTFHIGYGANEDGELTLDHTWITAGPGSSMADSDGAGTDNTAILNIGTYSRLEMKSGGRFYIGYDGTAVINVEPDTDDPEWETPSGSLRTRSAGLAQMPGSSATINLIGPLARWNPQQWSVDIGVAGEATVNVLDGAYISNTHRIVIGGSGSASDTGEPDFVGGTATLNIDGEGSLLTTTRDDVYYSIGRIGTGTVNVTNGGLIDMPGRIYVASQEGGDGTLNIESGGVVNTTSRFRVNSSSSSRGYVKIDGPGSALNVDETTSISYLGNTGTEGASGAMEILNGGAANFSSGSLRVANQADSTGEVIVDGEGSLLTVARFFQIGWEGNASLQVTNGGVVEAGFSGSWISGVSRRDTADGYVLIDGANSRATFNNRFYVAASGTDIDSDGVGKALVEITNGGLLEVATGLPVRDGGTVELQNGTIRMTEEEPMTVAGNEAVLTGQGTVEGDLVIARDPVIAGTGDGIALTGKLSGSGKVENLSIGSTEVVSSVGPMTLNNVRFDGDSSKMTIVLDSPEMDNLVSFDGDTDFSGVALDVSFDPFAPATNVTAQIFNYTGSGSASYNFASITLPEDWRLTDGLLHHKSNDPGNGGGSDTVFEEWGSDYGLSGNDAQSDADPDGDGFTNLEEFAFGTNPTEPTTSLVTFEKSESALVLSWGRRTGDGISYTIESSVDLISWTEVADADPTVVSDPDLPSGYERVEWSVEISDNGPRAFYRVQADVPGTLLP